jgi:hypothetical protein
MSQETLDQTEVETLLREWRKAYDTRDDVIRFAHASGLSVLRIHHLTGVARTTITRILRSDA